MGIKDLIARAKRRTLEAPREFRPIWLTTRARAACGTTLLAIVGPMGSGKTVFARAIGYLARASGRRVIRSSPVDQAPAGAERIEGKEIARVFRGEMGGLEGSVVILDEGVVELGVGRGREALKRGVEKFVVTSRHKKILFVVVSQHEELSAAMQRVLPLASVIYMDPSGPGERAWKKISETLPRARVEEVERTYVRARARKPGRGKAILWLRRLPPPVRGFCEGLPTIDDRRGFFIFDEVRERIVKNAQRARAFSLACLSR